MIVLEFWHILPNLAFVIDRATVRRLPGNPLFRAISN